MNKRLLILMFALLFDLKSATALIPFDQAGGMYSATKDEYKEYSPLWAMAAVHGPMLKLIRFYGNYQSKSHVNEDGLTVEVDEGKDAIARIIKRLFNSPDGINFVPSTYEADPVGNLGRHLDRLDDILRILIEPAKKTGGGPGEEILDTFRVIKELKAVRKSLSGTELEQLRRTIAQKERELKVLQGEQQHKGQQAKQGTQVERLVAVFDEIADIDKLSVKKLQGLQKIVLRGIGQESETSEEEDLSGNVTDLEGLKSDAIKGMHLRNEEFAHLLLRAFNVQSNLAAPPKGEDKDQQLYPENIVVISLLSYFVTLANNKEDLKKLPCLMKDDPSFYEIKPFSKEDYAEEVKKVKSQGGSKSLQSVREFRNNAIRIMTSSEHPELSFLLSMVYLHYERFMSTPIVYNGGVPYKNFGIFPDCGETSLRNFIFMLLSMGNGGSISQDLVDNLIQNIQRLNPGVDPRKNPNFKKVLAYFDEYPDIGLAPSPKAHADWAEIVSNLNGGKNPKSSLDVQYGRGEKYLPLYEIKSSYLARVFNEVQGMINMMNVIAKLIPDQVLNEPWAKTHEERITQLNNKFKRLCQLFSTEKYDVETDEIKNVFGLVDVKVNYTQQFVWQFKDGHFAIFTTIGGGNDWRDSYTVENPKYPNNWMASLYFPGTQNPIAKIYSPGLQSQEACLEISSFVLKQRPAFVPLIARWIIKSVHYQTDVQAADELVDFLDSFYDDPRILEVIKDPQSKMLTEKGMNALLFATARLHKFHLLSILLGNGGNVNVVDENGNTLLHLALMNPEGEGTMGTFETVKALVDAKINVSATNDEGRTPLVYFAHVHSLFAAHLSLKFKKPDEIIDYLLDHGADVNIPDKFGEHFIHQVVRAARLDLLQKIIKKGADVNARDAQGQTVIFLNPRTLFTNPLAELLQILLENGADPLILDNGGKTVLQHAVSSSRALGPYLDAGIPLDFESNQGETALMTTSGQIVSGQTATAKLLIQRGADINHQNKDKQTLFHKVIMKIIADVKWEGLNAYKGGPIRFLIENGANPDIKDINGKTPLDLVQSPALLDKIKTTISSSKS